jgi:hypothetical protein
LRAGFKEVLHFGKSRFPAIGGVQDTESLADIEAAASQERTDDFDGRISIFLGNDKPNPRTGSAARS